MTILIVSEKPSSSMKIAHALADGKVQKKSNYGVGYYIFDRKGEEIIVAPAVGHLFLLGEDKKKKAWDYPVFKTKWNPVYNNKFSTWSKKYYQNLEKLSKKADKFISACDYDVEGSVIAYNILRFICKVKDGKRMKFSTLTSGDLIKAYDEASPHLDFEQIEAGLTRHELDFLWGINTSRALTLSLKHAGLFKTLSTGRVQGPTLNILWEREKEIKAFVPVPFWELQLTGEINGKEVLANHITGKFWKKDEASNAFKKCKGKDGGIEKVEEKKYKQNPPVPFDLTTLQREAYKVFGYSPKQTLDTAQALYEKALISYPRTSSQKLPAKLGLKSIIRELKKQKEYSSFCDNLLQKPLKPNEGKKSDPAHPAIYPTGAEPKTINKYQKKLYDLIVKRFLAVFAEPAIRERMKVIINIQDEHFISEGFRTLTPNWIEIYEPYVKFKEVLLPPIKEGDKYNNNKLEMLDKETSPPSRYTQATVLKEMEKLGLGTKATRASILQTLYDRGYIEERSIQVTKFGEAVIDVLAKYCDEIISVDLTREFEDDMVAVREGNKKRKEIIDGAVKTLEKTLGEFKNNEEKVGKELLEALREVLIQESTIGPCKCGETLVIRKSRFGKRFVGCRGYPKCTETFSLPHTGIVKPSKEKCECGLFVVVVKNAGKRPWKLCVRCGFKNKFKTNKKGDDPKKTDKTKIKPKKKTVKKTAKKTTKKTVKKTVKRKATKTKKKVAKKTKK